MLKTNYHTHSLYCDGNDSLEELVLEAINKKFDILGFSSHSLYPFAEDWHIAPKNFNSYVEEVRSLSKKYEEKIKILCGFEADFVPCFSKPSLKNYEKFSPDFLIGSVHYVPAKNGIVAVDDKTENVKKGLEELFGGNGKKLVCEYFLMQKEMLKTCDFQILGHADVIRKRNSVLHFFNEKDLWYKKELKTLVKEVKKAGVIVEINTGAIARKVLDSFYPSSELLSLFFENGIPVMINSDCHNKADLDCAFESAFKAAISAGYKEVAYITEDKKIAFQKIDLSNF